MHAETESRWMVLGADRRHVSLGRTEPSEAEVMAASDALAAQGLSGWLARMQGEYYRRQKVTLEPLQRIGAAHDADWQAALAEFHAARRRSISTGTQQRGPHFGTYSRIHHRNSRPKSKGAVVR
ncbi:MAG: hypothetical protein INF79_07700 [Roseomonas sp.]|nr:hypothetical protein [Roseomonas sp.]